MISHELNELFFKSSISGKKTKKKKKADEDISFVS